ncbi:MAG: hypothetical protein SFU86_13305 [Pirellulaceae bacterium]|nr:hypothetical protein [Pirellulaceae bacterium]
MAGAWGGGTQSNRGFGNPPIVPPAKADMLLAEENMLRVAVVGADEQIRAALGSFPGVLLVATTEECDAVLNPDRYLPSRQLIHRELSAGKLGEPGLVRMHRWLGAAAKPDKSSPLLPTGLLQDLDVALWLVGRPVELVFAVERAAHGRFTQVQLGFAGAGMALIDYTDRLPAGEGYAALSVIGSAGAAYADDHQNMQLLFRGGRPQGLRTDERAAASSLMIREFAADLAAGHDLRASVADWRTVLRVAGAAQASLATREAVRLEDA